MGATVLEVKAQGHPDIKATLGSRLLAFEVEVAPVARRTHELKADDLQSIAHRDRGEHGYLAVLNWWAPAAWIIVDYAHMKSRGLGPVPLVMLRAYENLEMSEECSREFVDLVDRHGANLRGLPFRILCDRALRNDPL
jgi:hypothetical protein